MRSNPSGTAVVRDHRWTGFLIGAAALGVATAYAGWELCADSEYHHSTGTCVLIDVPATAIGAVVGGGIGGMVGSLFPKHTPR